VRIGRKRDARANRAGSSGFWGEETPSERRDREQVSQQALGTMEKRAAAALYVLCAFVLLGIAAARLVPEPSLQIALWER
jgi:hypothetical protein